MARLLAPGLAALLLLACGERPEPGTGSTGGCDIAKVRSLAESCCMSYGIDACGAGLFCAAFDGRTVATCYPNNSRTAGQTCTQDTHCMSATCGSKQLCAALPTEACKPEWGCAPLQGARSVCIETQCRLVSDGYCATDGDCQGGAVCRADRCRDAATAKYAGEACTDSSECLAGNCFKNLCQCSKETHLGCPGGTQCSGGNHVVWGTQCG